MKTAEQFHNDVAPAETHWYIMMVGAAPEYNGKGFGRELMEKIGDLADEAGALCYLECAHSNFHFYEKMGFSVAAKQVIEDLLAPNREPIELYAMIREPLKRA